MRQSPHQHSRNTRDWEGEAEEGPPTDPVQPDTKTKSPDTTAREYPICSSKVDPELMSLRSAMFY